MSVRTAVGVIHWKHYSSNPIEYTSHHQTSTSHMTSYHFYRPRVIISLMSTPTSPLVQITGTWKRQKSSDATLAQTSGSPRSITFHENVVLLYWRKECDSSVSNELTALRSEVLYGLHSASRRYLTILAEEVERSDLHRSLPYMKTILHLDRKGPELQLARSDSNPIPCVRGRSENNNNGKNEASNNDIR